LILNYFLVSLHGQSLDVKARKHELGWINEQLRQGGLQLLINDVGRWGKMGKVSGLRGRLYQRRYRQVQDLGLTLRLRKTVWIKI
jgi:hypothetical protein